MVAAAVICVFDQAIFDIQILVERFGMFNIVEQSSVHLKAHRLFAVHIMMHYPELRTGEAKGFHNGSDLFHF